VSHPPKSKKECSNKKVQKTNNNPNKFLFSKNIFKKLKTQK
jgi:hypothetical protein